MNKETKISLTGFELFIILVMTISTIAFLIAPGPSYPKVQTSVWYVPFLALIPGLIYTLIYQSLIANSPYPLPRMFEYYWGTVFGWILSGFYALFFLIWAAFWVRSFLDFQLALINPLQPIAVLLAGILVVALYGLKRGVTATVRALEVIFGINILLQVFLIAIGLTQADFRHLLPLYHTRPLAMASAIMLYSRYNAVAMIILILGYFITDNSKPGKAARGAILTSAVILSLTIMATIGVIGNLTLNDTYPIFDMVRRLHIGTFMRNLDAFYIANWFVGIFAGIYILWFGFIYILQQMFRLSDYRPLASGTVIILGVMAVAWGSSSIEVRTLQLQVFYPLIMIFNVGIPFLTWLFGLIRGKIKLKPGTAQNRS